MNRMCHFPNLLQWSNRRCSAALVLWL
jgi:hypothetical protein